MLVQRYYSIFHRTFHRQQSDQALLRRTKAIEKQLLPKKKTASSDRGIRKKLLVEGFSSTSFWKHENGANPESRKVNEACKNGESQAYQSCCSRETQVVDRVANASKARPEE